MLLKLFESSFIAGVREGQIMRAASNWFLILFCLQAVLVYGGA